MLSHKAEELIVAYRKANNARHYCYKQRGIAGVKWTKKQEAALHVARRKKLRLSKKLRAQLKKEGFMVIWGDMNQVCGVEPIIKRKLHVKWGQAIKLNALMAKLGLKQRAERHSRRYK